MPAIKMHADDAVALKLHGCNGQYVMIDTSGHSAIVIAAAPTFEEAFEEACGHIGYCPDVLMDLRQEFAATDYGLIEGVLEIVMDIDEADDYDIITCNVELDDVSSYLTSAP